MMRKLVSLGCFLAIGTVVVAADLTTIEKRALQSVQNYIRKAGADFKSSNFESSGQNIQKAMNQMKIAVKAGSPALYDELQPAMKRITQAHAMLELEGIELPPIPKLKRPEAKPEMKKETPKPAATPDAGGVSFTKQVAPILTSKCGRCHVQGNRGNFTMNTFAALMKGPPEGVVVFAGDTVGSRLIETIVTGDMPRGGAKVSPMELKTLKDWISQGAKFDGSDPTAPIGSGNAPAPVRNRNPKVNLATGKETVSFATDVAPLLVENCSGCHIGAMRTRGGLRMDTFAQLLRGGDSGEIVMAGKSADSLLIKKLKGEGIEGERMPAGGKPALADKEIQLISTWIDEGATLDGMSATQPIGVMAQLAWASKASAAELSDKRKELATASMKLAAAGGTVNSEISEHFMVTGTASQGTLKLVAEQAEMQIKIAQSVASGKSGEDYFRGRATIFVLPGRYQYSEFAKMAEQRSVPRDWSSHWKFDGVNAYIAVVATDRDEAESIQQRLYSPIIALAVATRGADVPRWFAEGVGAAMANRKGSNDRDAKLRRETETGEALAAMKNAKTFLEGKLSPVQSDRIGAAIAATMLDRTYRKSFDLCLRELAAGKPFAVAFATGFRYPVEAYVENWTKWARGG